MAGRKRKFGMRRTACGRIAKSQRGENMDDVLASAVARKRKHGEPLACVPNEGEAIYVMQTGGFVKVGYSKNVAARQSSLQESGPTMIDIVWVARGTVEDIRLLERLVHRKLINKTQRARGEWYITSANTAIRVIKETARERGIVIYYGEPGGDDIKIRSCIQGGAAWPSVI